VYVSSFSCLKVKIETSPREEEQQEHKPATSHQQPAASNQQPATTLSSLVSGGVNNPNEKKPYNWVIYPQTSPAYFIDLN